MAGRPKRRARVALERARPGRARATRRIRPLAAPRRARKSERGSRQGSWEDRAPLPLIEASAGPSQVPALDIRNGEARLVWVQPAALVGLAIATTRRTLRRSPRRSAR